MERLLLSGNEAIALGAYEAGVRVGTGYPGTPSTEILESLTSYPGVYTEWSVNEKVALEVALGAAMAGARAIVTMKHVGLNVASDPLFTASYTGVKAGLVIACADDPAMHSSQNEQDNRHYARAAKVPMLEPSDSQEAKDFTKLAFELSERYDTPVILRSTTRVSHSKSLVHPSGVHHKRKTTTGFTRNIQKYVMIPAYARLRHLEVEKRMRRLERDANRLDINRIEFLDTSAGFITSGMCYNYVREVFPDFSVLKLGMIYPIAEELILKFYARIEKVYVVEELDPFLEQLIKAMGLRVDGKKYFPITGELNPDLIFNPLKGEIYHNPERYKSKANSLVVNENSSKSEISIPPRPPTLCPGCPHRTVFTILHKLGLNVTGDIGCYTLGALPPFLAIDTCIDMGASITVAQGIEIAEGTKIRKRTVSVLGDSTFAHSGIPGLLNAAYNKRNSLIIVLDNGTTAMTGMQPNPCSGERIDGKPTVKLDYEKLCEAFGISKEDVKIVDAYNPAEIEGAITAMINTDRLSFIVVKGECVVLKRRKIKIKKTKKEQ